MNGLPHLKSWFELDDDTRRNIFGETGRQIGLPAHAVEKDWWVVHALSLIFSIGCGTSIIFKGGTSLSKGWNLVQRFSEDIDLALDREYLGFKGPLSKGDIRRLRKASHNFITSTFRNELQAAFTLSGFLDVSVNCRETENSDQDPVIIEIYYPKLTEIDTYLKPGLLVELGSRSLREPFTVRTFSSLVAENYTSSPFADMAIQIPVVNPERTFLEKIFLLHEEFQRPKEKIRVDRLSRHLYDIEKLSDTPYGQKAFENAKLYKTIVTHRSRFTPVSGVDYNNHTPDKIKFIPPSDQLHFWGKDYNEMGENMIYGDSLPFPKLIKSLTDLQFRVNSIQWE